jgi:hypothetical protein
MAVPDVHCWVLWECAFAPVLVVKAGRLKNLKVSYNLYKEWHGSKFICPRSRVQVHARVKLDTFPEKINVLPDLGRVQCVAVSSSRIHFGNKCFYAGQIFQVESNCNIV